MTIRLRPSLLIAAIALLPAAVSAQDTPLAGSIGIGTTGITLEAKATLTSTLVARGSYNYLDFDVDDQEYDDIDYEVAFDGSTATLAADYHPFRNAWMLTAGLYLGERSAGLRATPTGNVEIGGQTFSPSQVGTLVGDVSVGDVAPFIGLGWDNTFYTRSRWSWYIRGGVIISDSPSVELSSVGGSLSNDPALIAELEAEEALIEDDVDEYRLYPVLEAGGTLRF